jgi:hypothetical protein
VEDRCGRSWCCPLLVGHLNFLLPHLSLPASSPDCQHQTARLHPQLLSFCSHLLCCCLDIVSTKRSWLGPCLAASPHHTNTAPSQHHFLPDRRVSSLLSTHPSASNQQRCTLYRIQNLHITSHHINLPRISARTARA